MKTLILGLLFATQAYAVCIDQPNVGEICGTRSGKIFTTVRSGTITEFDCQLYLARHKHPGKEFSQWNTTKGTLKLTILNVCEASK